MLCLCVDESSKALRVGGGGRVKGHSNKTHCDEARALHAARYDGNETVLQKYISIVRTVQGNDQTTWNAYIV